MGGKRAGTIESQEVVTSDTFHLFQDLVALERSEDLLEHGTQGLGLHGIEKLTS